MSFGFSIGDFIAVVELARKVRRDFAGAPDQFRHITDELRNLSIIIQDVDAFVSGHDTITQAQRESFVDITTSCRAVLQDCERLANQYSVVDSAHGPIRKRAKRTWKRLKWEPDEVRDLRGRINLSIAMLDSFTQCFTRDNVSQLVKRMERDEAWNILNWLDGIDYGSQQSDFARRRQPRTGQWLLMSEDYQSWICTPKQTLFCPGIPGAGKTILSSIVVDDLLDRFGKDPSMGICYIYCNFRRHNDQKLESLMSNLLKQLAYRDSHIHGSVEDLYNSHFGRSTRPTLEDFRRALHSVVTGFTRVYMVIDALDECQTSELCQSRFISELKNLSLGTAANVLATSRPIPEISSRFENYATIGIHASDNDIGAYLEGHMSRLPGFVARNPKLQIEVKQRILECVDGMFLLAQLHLDSLKGKKSPKAVRTTLANLSKGSNAYDSAYHDIMDRICSQLPDQKELALRTLSWLTYAKRPLQPDGLLHVLAIEIGDTRFDEENLPDLHDVVSNCSGLVTVDKDSNIIRLVHFTTQEFLTRNLSIWLPDAEAVIARTCFTSILFSSAPAPDLYYREPCERFRHCPSLFRCQPSCPPICFDWWEYGDADPQSAADTVARLASFTKETTALHLAIRYEFAGAAKILVNLENIKEIDSSRGSPCQSAARMNRPSVLAVLLRFRAEHGLTFDPHDITDYKILERMMYYGDWENVLLILQQGFDVNSTFQGGHTLLSMVTDTDTNFIGPNPTLRPVLDYHPNLRIRDNAGRTTLHIVALKGTISDLKLVLPYFLDDINAKDNNGFTALAVACRLGLVAMVQELLQVPNIDVAEIDNSGRTALWWANICFHGNGPTIIKMLKDAVDTEKGKYAAESGEEFGNSLVKRVRVKKKVDNLEVGSVHCAFCTAPVDPRYFEPENSGLLEIYPACMLLRIPFRRIRRVSAMSSKEHGF